MSTPTTETKAARFAQAGRQAERLGSILHDMARRALAGLDIERLRAEATDLRDALVLAVPGRTHPARGAMEARNEAHACTACRCAEAGIDRDGAEVPS